MCERCAREYADPLDRRFHAQPDACFECGPHVSLAWHRGSVVWGTTREESDAIFARAVELLCAGKILAVKGLGGFHLVCDAGNAQAVAALRTRKRREGKAFAVMMANVEDVRQMCEVGNVEQSILEGSQHPIVLLRKRPDAAFTPKLADNLPELGVMLPYTPVQHLLLHDFAQAKRAAEGKGENPPMLVMTSGNLHDEPIVTGDVEAYEKLACVADAFLGNDRAILARYDDSVVRVVQAGCAGEAVQFIRRARGYSPVPLEVPAACRSSEQADAAVFSSTRSSRDFGTLCLSEAEQDAPARALGAESNEPLAILAVGPEQKNTFTLTRGKEAFVSQHVGDMENAETYDAWLDALKRYEKLFEVAPARLACDLHPEYLTTKWAHERARELGLPLEEVQHHHAHIVSVMAENGLFGPVCGIAFDGTGYGADGAIWGGEVLLSNLEAFERVINFAYVPMPGGAAAVKHPLRMAYGVLWAFDLLDHPAAKSALETLGAQAQVCDQMIEQSINTPATSSVGRLFDAASALLGICTEPLYEGEPAILLEAAALSSAVLPNSGRVLGEPAAAGNEPVASGEPASEGSSSTYAIGIVKNTATSESTAQDTSVVLFDAAPAFRALLDDKAAGVPVSVIARRFHDAFVQAIVSAAELVRGLYDIETVVLSGGVFMNRYLTEHTLAALEAAGFTAAINRDLPPNDGCISFGQAVVAWTRATK